MEMKGAGPPNLDLMDVSDSVDFGCDLPHLRDEFWFQASIQENKYGVPARSYADLDGQEAYRDPRDSFSPSKASVVNKKCRIRKN